MQTNLSFLSNLGLTVIPHAKLADYTTFRLGGPCRALVECRNAKKLTAAVTALREQKLPFLLMGFGSNILASDHGVDQIIVRYSSDTPLISRRGNILTVDAATQFDALINRTVEDGLEGLTDLSGIPGTVGGAIAGNAGAYGQQISDRLVELALLYPDGTIKTVKRDAIHFGYRDSAIKHTSDIVLEAVFELEPSDNPAFMKTEREEKLNMRLQKHGRWQNNPCAGSFFKNVLPSSNAGQRQAAGWFLEQSGCKSLNVNGAHPYQNHANIVTRDDGAKAQDVYDLTLRMAKSVKEKFGLELMREVRLVGQFNNAPDCDQNRYW